MQQKELAVVASGTPPPSSSSSMNPNPGGSNGCTTTTSRSPQVINHQQSIFALGGPDNGGNFSPHSPQVSSGGGHQQQQPHHGQLGENVYLLSDRLIDENDTFTCGKCSASFSRLQSFVAHKNQCQTSISSSSGSSSSSPHHHSIGISSSVGSPHPPLPSPSTSSSSPARQPSSQNSHPLLVQSTTATSANPSPNHQQLMVVGVSDNVGSAVDHHLGDTLLGGLLQSSASSSGSPISGVSSGDTLLQPSHPHNHQQQSHHPQHSLHLNHRSISLSNSTSTSSSSPHHMNTAIQGDGDDGIHHQQHILSDADDLLSSLTPSLDANMMSQMMVQLPGGGNGQPMSPGSLHLHLQQADEEMTDDHLFEEDHLQNFITGGDGSSNGVLMDSSSEHHHHHLQQSGSTLTVDTSIHHHLLHQSLGYHDVPPNVELLGGGGAVHHGQNLSHHLFQHRSVINHHHQHAFLNSNSPVGLKSPSPSSATSPSPFASLLHPGLSANSTDPLMPLVASPRISSSSSSSTAASPSTSMILNATTSSASPSSSGATVADTSSSPSLLTSCSGYAVDLMLGESAVSLSGSADNSSHSVGSPSRFLGPLPPISSLSGDHQPLRPSSLPSIVEHHPSPSSSSPSPVTSTGDQNPNLASTAAAAAPRTSTSPSLTVIHHRPSKSFHQGWKQKPILNSEGFNQRKARSSSPSSSSSAPPTSTSSNSLPSLTSLLAKATKVSLSTKRVVVKSEQHSSSETVAIEGVASQPPQPSNNAEAASGGNGGDIQQQQSYLAAPSSTPLASKTAAASDNKADFEQQQQQQSSLLDSKLGGGNGSGSPRQLPPPPSSAAVHICKYCDRQFSKHSDKMQHLACHSGERPYQCLHCGKSFQQKCNLRKHIQTHRLVREELETVYRRSLEAMPHTVDEAATELVTNRRLTTTTTTNSQHHSSSCISVSKADRDGCKSATAKSIVTTATNSNSGSPVKTSDQLQPQQQPKTSAVMMTGGKMSECDILEEIVELELEAAAAAAANNSGSSPPIVASNAGYGLVAMDNNINSSSSSSNMGLHSMVEELTGTVASQQRQQETAFNPDQFENAPLIQNQSLCDPPSLPPLLSNTLTSSEAVSEMMEMDFLQTMDLAAIDAAVSSSSSDLLATSLVNSASTISTSSTDQDSSFSAITTFTSIAITSKNSKHSKASSPLPSLVTITSNTSTLNASTAPSSELEAQLQQQNEVLFAQNKAELLGFTNVDQSGSSPLDPLTSTTTTDRNDFQCPFSQCTFYSEVDGEVQGHFRLTHQKCPKVQVFDEKERVNKLVYRCLRKDSCSCLLPTVDDFFHHLMDHKRSDVDLADQALKDFLPRAEAEHQERVKHQKVMKRCRPKGKSTVTAITNTDNPSVAVLQQKEATTEIMDLDVVALLEEGEGGSSTPPSSSQQQKEQQKEQSNTVAKTTAEVGTSVKSPRVLYKDKKYRCKKCNQRFSVQSDLETHTATDSHCYPCSVCSETFPSDSHMKRHLSMNHGATFKCATCERAFKTATYLKVHSVIHSGEKPFVCHICEAAFNRRDKLKRHELVHNPVKEFKCSVGQCQREFSRPDKLKAHMATHSGARPYHCVQCSRSFTRPAHLKKHIKSHENVGEGGSGGNDVAVFKDTQLQQQQDIDLLATETSDLSLIEMSDEGSGISSGQQQQQMVYFADGTAAIVIAESHRANQDSNPLHHHHNFLGHHRRGSSFLENEGKENEKEVQQEFQQLQQQQVQVMIRQLQQPEMKKPENITGLQKRQHPTEVMKKGVEKRIKKKPTVKREIKEEVVDVDDEDDSQWIYLTPNELKGKMEVFMLEDEEEKGDNGSNGVAFPSVDLKPSSSSAAVRMRKKNSGIEATKSSSGSVLSAVVFGTATKAEQKSLKATASSVRQNTINLKKAPAFPTKAALADPNSVITNSDPLSSSSSNTTPISTLQSSLLASNVSGIKSTHVKAASASPERRSADIKSNSTSSASSARLLPPESSLASFKSSPPSSQQPIHLTLPADLINSNSNYFLLYSCPRCQLSFFNEMEALVHQTNCGLCASRTKASVTATTTFDSHSNSPPPTTCSSSIKPSLMLVDPSIIAQHGGTATAASNGL